MVDSGGALLVVADGGNLGICDVSQAVAVVDSRVLGASVGVNAELPYAVWWVYVGVQWTGFFGPLHPYHTRVRSVGLR